MDEEPKTIFELDEKIRILLIILPWAVGWIWYILFPNVFYPMGMFGGIITAMCLSLFVVITTKERQLHEIF